MSMIKWDMAFALSHFSFSQSSSSVQAISLVTFSTFLISLQSMIAKILSSVHNPVEIVFARNIVALIIVLAILVARREVFLIKTQRPFAQLIRACVGTLGIFSGFWAFSLMPMAQATALIFTAPLFATVLSAIFLKEKIGPYRISAVIAGFLGVLVIAGPLGGIEFGPLCVGLFSGLCNGGVAVCLRWLGNTENALTTVFYFVVIGLVTMAIPSAMTYTEFHPLSWVLIPCLGVVGVASLISKTHGYRMGEASLLVLFTYTQIVWALVFDILLWDTWPAVSVLAGAVIIIASNICIVWREKTIHHQMAENSGKNITEKG